MVLKNSSEHADPLFIVLRVLETTKILIYWLIAGLGISMDPGLIDCITVLQCFNQILESPLYLAGSGLNSPVLICVRFLLSIGNNSSHIQLDQLIS